MTNNPISRDYKFSDVELKQTGRTLISIVTRDISEFSVFGVTNTSVVEGLLDMFDQILPDSYFRGKISIARQNRDEAQATLRQRLRILRAMTKARWGNSTNANLQIYKWPQLYTSRLNRLSQLAKNAHQIATTQLASLTGQGLTQAFLDTLEADRISLNNKIDALDRLARNRDLTTQNRILKGNKLYAEATRLADFGKNIFAHTDEAKYNDYIIHNQPSSKPPIARQAIAKGAVTAQINATPIENATLEFIKTETNTLAYSTQTNPDGTYEIAPIAPGNYRIRIARNGYITHQSQTLLYLPGQTGVHNAQLVPI